MGRVPDRHNHRSAAAPHTAIGPSTTLSFLGLNDALDQSITQAKVQITGGYHAGEDVLSVAPNPYDPSAVTTSFDATTGTLTITSTGGSVLLGSDAVYNALEMSLRYTDTATTPSPNERTVTVTVTNSAGTSAPLTHTLDFVPPGWHDLHAGVWRPTTRIRPGPSSLLTVPTSPTTARGSS